MKMTDMNRVPIYALKIWMSGVIFAPFLFTLWHSYDQNIFDGSLTMIVLMIVFGLYHSIISFVTLLAVSAFVFSTELNVYVQRLLIQIAVIIISLLTFRLSGIGAYGFDIQHFYILAMSIAVWTVKIGDKKEVKTK